METALGRVSMAMGCYACDACGGSARPREAAQDIAGSMTPAARRMASLAGSSCCYAEADGLLAELAGVNYGPKRIERATRAVGDDLESRREAALSGSITVLGEGAARDAAPERKSLKEEEILCVALDGTGVPARPSETAGRAGKAGEARTREAKVGAAGQGRAADGGRFGALLRRGESATTRRATRRWRGGCCANWAGLRAGRRRGVHRRRRGLAAAAVRGVVRTRSRWSTSSTPRSTCGRRPRPVRPATSGGRCACAGSSGRADKVLAAQESARAADYIEAGAQIAISCPRVADSQRRSSAGA